MVLIWEGKRGNMLPKGSESRHRKKKRKKSNSNIIIFKNPIIFNLLLHISCSPGVSCCNGFQDFPWNVEIPFTQTMASLVLLVFWKHKNMFVFSCDPLGEFPHWFGVWDFHFFLLFLFFQKPFLPVSKNLNKLQLPRLRVLCDWHPTQKQTLNCDHCGGNQKKQLSGMTFFPAVSLSVKWMCPVWDTRFPLAGASC